MSLTTYQDARGWAKANSRRSARAADAAVAGRERLWRIHQRSQPHADRGRAPDCGGPDGATPIGPPIALAMPHDAEPHRGPDLLVLRAAAREVRALTDRIELPTDLSADRWNCRLGVQAG